MPGQEPADELEALELNVFTITVLAIGVLVVMMFVLSESKPAQTDPPPNPANRESGSSPFPSVVENIAVHNRVAVDAPLQILVADLIRSLDDGSREGFPLLAPFSQIPQLPASLKSRCNDAGEFTHTKGKE